MGKVKFNLVDMDKLQRKKVVEVLFDRVASLLVEGRIPTFHVVHLIYVEGGCVVDNHYMTPVSFEPIDEEGGRMISVHDFLFFLKLLVFDERTCVVEVDEDRPAVIFEFHDFNRDLDEFLSEEELMELGEVEVEEG